MIYTRNALQPNICKCFNIRQLNRVDGGGYVPAPQIRHPCLQIITMAHNLENSCLEHFHSHFFLSLFVLTATWHRGSFNLSKPVFPFPLLVLKEHLNGSRRNKKQGWDALKMNEIVLLLNCKLYLSLCTCRTPSAFIINVCS